MKFRRSVALDFYSTMIRQCSRIACRKRQRQYNDKGVDGGEGSRGRGTFPAHIHNFRHDSRSFSHTYVWTRARARICMHMHARTHVTRHRIHAWTWRARMPLRSVKSSGKAGGKTRGTLRERELWLGWRIPGLRMRF